MGFDRTGYDRLNGKCMIAMYIKYAVALAILIAIMSGICVYLKDETVLIYCTVILIICVIYVAVAPQIFYRRYAYILTNDKIDVIRGVFIVKRTLVPIERIHQVEVIRGPINGMFGLADVVITTAGGTARLEYLEQSIADSIASELNAFINSIAKDR